MPANFRSYEGQLRLLTAVLAAHPELKLNYKDVAKHYGSDWSESGIEHFFRPIKKSSKAIQAMVKRGEDAATLQHHNVSFQFRAIKQAATNLRQGAPAGPATPAATNSPKTPCTTTTSGGRRKRAAPSSAGTGTGGKTPARKKAKAAASTTTTPKLVVIDDYDGGGGGGDGGGDGASDADAHAPVIKPLVNEAAMRAHKARMGFQDPPPPPPAAASNNHHGRNGGTEAEDVKVTTTSRPAAGAGAAPGFSFSPPLAAPATGGSRYGPSPFLDGSRYSNNNNNNNNHNNGNGSNGTGQQQHQAYAEDADGGDDEDEYEI